MKLFIEVEITPEELPLATELFKTLRALTDHVKTRDPSKLYANAISKLENPDQLDTGSTEIGAILTELAGPNNEYFETAFDELMQAFMAVVFNKELVVRQQSVVPYFNLLPRLPEAIRIKMRDGLISKVLKHLTAKRPLNAARMEFFAYAEAFATLVNLEFVSISGAVSTIITLLKKPDTRCAAITMLGKTVELCLHQLNEKCDGTKLNELSTTLRTVTDEVFQYDINYIEESMGWTRPLSAPEATRGSHATDQQGYNARGAHTFRAVTSYNGHTSIIFAMCYDASGDRLISGSKDGKLVDWNVEGQAASATMMPRHYACSMDIQSAQRTLLVCGVAKEDVTNSAPAGRIPPPPCVAAYEQPPRSWKEKGAISQDTTKLVSCIKAFIDRSDSGFITGESVLPNAVHKTSELVCYYDSSTASSFGALSPLSVYAEHEGLVTCLSLFPRDSSVFMSGSRDCTIRVWDQRSARCVGMLGVLHDGQIKAHDQMITCLDATDYDMVLSAGMDQHVLQWDFRVMGTGGANPISALPLDKSAVLKVAIGGGPKSAAISTLQGLYLADFSGSTPSVVPAEFFTDGRRMGRYHDLKWAHSRNMLFAGGDEQRVDLFSYH